MCQHHQNFIFIKQLNSSARDWDKVAAVGHEKPGSGSKLYHVIYTFLAQFCQIMTLRTCSANRVGGLGKKNILNITVAYVVSIWSLRYKGHLAGCLASKLAIPTCHGASIQKGFGQTHTLHCIRYHYNRLHWNVYI